MSREEVMSDEVRRTGSEGGERKGKERRNNICEGMEEERRAEGNGDPLGRALACLLRPTRVDICIGKPKRIGPGAL